MCGETWKRNVDLCCLQEVIWRGCWDRLLVLRGRRYELRWSESQEGYGGVGVVVKKELYDKVMKVTRVDARVMSLDIVFKEKWWEWYVHVLHKVESRWWRFIWMKIYQENWPIIAQMNWLLEWKILADMLAETTMDFSWFMVDLVLLKKIKREGCY